MSLGVTKTDLWRAYRRMYRHRCSKGYYVTDLKKHLANILCMSWAAACQFDSWHVWANERTPPSKYFPNCTALGWWYIVLVDTTKCQKCFTVFIPISESHPTWDQSLTLDTFKLPSTLINPSCLTCLSKWTPSCKQFPHRTTLDWWCVAIMVQYCISHFDILASAAILKQLAQRKGC